jgi:haloacetate dehalogenase
VVFEGFSAEHVLGDGTRIFVRRAGNGPPLLLLHGFPETHVMWRDVAPRLARSFSVVCADLRGYGESECPPSDADHAPYAKRALARDMVAGGSPTGWPSTRRNKSAARLISADPDAVIEDAASQWGSGGAAFTAEARDACVAPLRDLAHAHAICEEYRAAASLDRAHDEADRAAGRKISCPLLVLWSASGALG